MGRLSSTDARWLRRWTIRLGVVAAIVLVAPALTVVAMISVVGIPLALAMMATPTLLFASNTKPIPTRPATPGTRRSA